MQRAARQQAEQAAAALSESEERLSLALRSGDMGAWRLDLAAGKRQFDLQVCRCLGIDPAGFGGSAEEFLAAVHRDDRAPLSAALERTIDSGAPYEVEYRALWPDGSLHHVAARGRLARDAAGAPRWVDGLVWDITERKLAEQTLRESEGRLQLAVAATSLGTWDFNPVSGALNWDARCKELFGLPPEAEVNYPTFRAGLHPEDREAAERAVQGALLESGGGRYDIEFRTVGLQDGKLRWIHATGQAFFDPAGQAVRFIGTVQDITRRKRAEEAL